MGNAEDIFPLLYKVLPLCWCFSVFSFEIVSSFFNQLPFVIELNAVKYSFAYTCNWLKVVWEQTATSRNKTRTDFGGQFVVFLLRHLCPCRGVKSQPFSVGLRKGYVPVMASRDLVPIFASLSLALEGLSRLEGCRSPYQAYCFEYSSYMAW